MENGRAVEYLTFNFNLNDRCCTVENFNFTNLFTRTSETTTTRSKIFGTRNFTQMKEHDKKHERKGGQISVIHSRQRFCMFIHLFLFYFIE